jgi:hypothetical protein
VSKRAFYVAVIGGRHFEGLLSGDGPCITCDNESVALGTCASIEQLGEIEFDVHNSRVTPYSWWITKYHTQPRISLQGLGELERRRLANEFGIRVGHDEPTAEPFWDSAAFRALSAWVKRYPSVAERSRDLDAYLRGWYDAACAAVDKSDRVGATRR